VELALRIVHLLAAIVWVGGTVALVFVAVPSAQRLEGEARARMLRDLGRRWRPIGWSALGVAIATGALIAIREHAFDTTSTRFDWVLGVKGALVGALVGGAYLHDSSGAGPNRLGHGHAAGRPDVLAGRQERPGRPLTGLAARAQLDAPAAAPARTDEIERERRAHGRATGDRQAGEAHVCRPCKGGSRQQERPGEEDAQRVSHDRVGGATVARPGVTFVRVS